MTFVQRWLQAAWLLCLCVKYDVGNEANSFCVRACVRVSAYAWGQRKKTGLDSGWVKRKERQCKKPARLLAKAPNSWCGSRWEEEAIDVLSSLRLTGSCLLPEWVKSNLSVSQGSPPSFVKATKADVTLHWLTTATVTSQRTNPSDVLRHCLRKEFDSKPISTSFSRIFSKAACFTCFRLPNYVVPLKSKRQKEKKNRWQWQPDSLILWIGWNDALVDQPLAAMLILERSWAVLAFEKSLHKRGSRGHDSYSLAHQRE